jgi:hypothetical protein
MGLTSIHFWLLFIWMHLYIYIGVTYHI